MIEAAGIFLAALVWWEIVLGAVLVVGFLWSLFEESGLFSLVTIAILLSISWAGAGALGASLATMSFGTLAGGAAIYIGLGLVWSVWKWRLFVVDKKENYISDCKYYEKDYDVETLRTKIARDKDIDVISFWIIAWPLSVIAYVLNDFIIDTIKAIAERMTTVYDKVTNRIISKI